MMVFSMISKIKLFFSKINKEEYLVTFLIYFLDEKSELFHDGGRYHIETSPLICSLTASVMKELNVDIQFYNNFLPRFNLTDCHQISLLILSEF